MKKNNLQQSPKQSTRLKLFVIAGSFAVLVGFLIFLFYNLGTPKLSRGAPGFTGAKTISSANTIVNEFTTLTTTVAAGATQLVVASNTLNSHGRFSANLAAGELIMIIQMQGATVNFNDVAAYGQISNYNNCGKYEFAEVASLSSTTKINLTAALKNSYTSTGFVQIVRVPRYTTLTVNSGASITTDDWDGTKGGIVAIEVSGATILNGTIDVTGKGFRGGVVQQNSNFPGNHTNFYRTATITDGGEKGESIAGYQTTYTNGRYGRGAPANGGGGGNSHNASGGGGANAGDTTAWDGLGTPDNSVSGWSTAWNLESTNFSLHTSSGGGRGGYTYSANSGNPLLYGTNNNSVWGGDRRYNNGGFGGRPLDYSTGRIFFGGGGGAGDSNDGYGTSGGDGGGIVYMLLGNNMSGTGSINANGVAAGTTIGPQGWDGSGGGGGGGTVILYTKNATISSITINAAGGLGGNQNNAGNAEAEGAGGGGGGGYIAIGTSSGVTLNVSGAKQGATNSPTMATFTPNGATKGAAGYSNGTPPANPYSGTSTLPVELTSFSAMPSNNVVYLKWTTASEHNNDYFSIDRSADGVHFEVIDYVTGVGNSTQSKNYSYTDNYPLQGISYYRLRQTDFDGQCATFKIIPVDFSAKLKGLQMMNASPNPFVDNCTVTFSSDKDAVADICIYSINGMLKKKEKINVSRGTNFYRFENQNLFEPGVYFINIAINGEKSASIKLMKLYN